MRPVTPAARRRGADELAPTCPGGRPAARARDPLPGRSGQRPTAWPAPHQRRRVLHQLPPSAFRDVQTPSLILDLDRVRHSYETLRRGFAGLRPRVFYSVKANGDPRLLAALDEAGSGFDVASVQEIRELRELGVP